jgi:CheY-like chemotaxis protein
MPIGKAGSEFFGIHAKIRPMKKQDQNSRAHDLLLLIFNLSQITLKEKIIIEGKGSTFYFTIPYDTGPLAQIPANQAVSQGSETILRKNLKILIAEDDETSELFIGTVVSHLSHDVLKAVTGTEAIEVCRNNPDIDLVLMDIRMPEMGGHEATRRIREFNKEVVIIAQTAYGLAGDREKAIESGCNDYISKPIKKDELLGLIQKYFRK